MPTPSAPAPAPLALTGQQTGDLVDILCAIFEPFELDECVRRHLSRELFTDFSSATHPKRKITSDLVRGLERMGETPFLVTAALAERPRSVRLREFAVAIGVSVPAAPGPRPDAGGRAVEFGQGVGALTAVLQSATGPGLLITVGAFRADFEACRDRIGWLRQYKALHDCLHNLQNMLVSIGFAAQQFLTNDAARASFETYRVDLRGLAQSARANAEGLPTASDEMEWIRAFDQINLDIDKALATDDAALMAGAIERLRGLQRHSADVNDHLLFVARDLRLERLYEAMLTIRDLLPAGDSASVSTIAAGAEALRFFRVELAAQVEEHDAWQWLETEFALAETRRAGTPAEKFGDWTAVRARIGHVCELNSGHPLADDLGGAVTRYADMPVTDPKPRIERAFLAVRATFARMFFQVDQNLLALTSQLAAQAGELDSLLRFLTGFTRRPATPAGGRP